MNNWCIMNVKLHAGLDGAFHMQCFSPRSLLTKLMYQLHFAQIPFQNSLHQKMSNVRSKCLHCYPCFSFWKFQQLQFHHNLVSLSCHPNNYITVFYIKVFTLNEKSSIWLRKQDVKMDVWSHSETLSLHLNSLLWWIKW